eukprot:tig00021537_g22301.t1
MLMQPLAFASPAVSQTGSSSFDVHGAADWRARSATCAAVHSPSASFAGAAVGRRPPWFGRQLKSNEGRKFAAAAPPAFSGVQASTRELLSGREIRPRAAAAILPVLSRPDAEFVERHVGAWRAFTDAALFALFVELGLRTEYALLCNIGLPLWTEGIPWPIANALLHLPASPIALSGLGEVLFWASLIAGAELGLQFTLNFRKRLNLPAFGRGVAEAAKAAGGSVDADAARAEAEAFLSALVSDVEDAEAAALEAEFEEEPTAEEVHEMLSWMASMESQESSGAVDLVWHLARSDDRAIREATADSLGDFACASNGWLAALEHLARDEDPDVRLAAVISLARAKDAGLLRPAEGMAFLRAYRRQPPATAPEEGAEGSNQPQASAGAGAEKRGRRAMLLVRRLGTRVELEVETLTPLQSFVAMLAGGAVAMAVELGCIYHQFDSPLRFLALGYVLGASVLLFPDDHPAWRLLRAWRHKRPAPAPAPATSS